MEDTTQNKTFEESLQLLEQVVKELESGNATLEESLKLFEQGIHLANSCQKQLDTAEKKVLFLTEQEAQV